MLPLSVAVELLLVNVWLKPRVKVDDCARRVQRRATGNDDLWDYWESPPVPIKARVPWLMVVFPV